MSQRDVPGRTNRPSLLSEQAPPPLAGDPPSILSKLDGRAAPPAAVPAPRKPGRMGGMAAGVLAAVVLGGGALAWALQGSDDGTDTPPVAAAAAPADAPAAAPAPAPEREVSAAAILDEVPGAGVAATAATLAAGAVAVAQPPAAHGGKGELAALLDKPATKGRAGAGAAPSSPAVKKKSESTRFAHKDKARSTDKKTAVAAAPRKKPAAKPAPQVDSDVALLAALLAHSKAADASGRSKTSAEYRRCNTLDSADASKCRERLCEASSKARAECRTLRADKAAG